MDTERKISPINLFFLGLAAVKLAGQTELTWGQIFKYWIITWVVLIVVFVGGFIAFSIAMQPSKVQIEQQKQVEVQQQQDRAADRERARQEADVKFESECSLYKSRFSDWPNFQGAGGLYLFWFEGQKKWCQVNDPQKAPKQQETWGEQENKRRHQEQINQQTEREQQEKNLIKEGEERQQKLFEQACAQKKRDMYNMNPYNYTHGLYRGMSYMYYGRFCNL